MQKVMSLDCAKAGNLRGAMELLPLPLDLPASFSQDVGWMLKCFYYWFLNVLSRINMTAFLFLFHFLAGSATYDFYWVSVAVLLGLRVVSVFSSGESTWHCCYYYVFFSSFLKVEDRNVRCGQHTETGFIFFIFFFIFFSCHKWFNGLVNPV